MSTNMRPAPHSHSLIEDGPVYGNLPHDLGASAQSYSTYSTSLHHVDPSTDPNISSYGVSPPAEHQAVNPSHDDIEHSGIHLETTLSSEGLPGGRQFQDIAPSGQQYSDFPPPTPPSAKITSTPNAPPAPMIPNSAPQGLFDMLPPPASTHSSWQALHDYAQSHASAHGYALSINTTAKNRSRIKLACVCYGAPKNTHKLTPETRVRKNRVSYKTGCKMWIEGKKHDDGLWVLRVGQPLHNHPGRASEGWAVQRKRTWGVQGGRIGVGGVTAKEEQKRIDSSDNVPSTALDETAPTESVDAPAQPPKPSHSLESGGLVWKIVEQEMLRKGGGPGQGRDRGVGRTVKVLEERLPGIHIFKRDVYNIRAQIKRARKAAGQQLGEGLDGSDNDNEEELESETRDNARFDAQNERVGAAANPEHGFSRIDPTLIAQCNSALKNMPRQEELEVERLRREVVELRTALAQRTKEVESKNGEIEGLRVQVELANMAMYNGRGEAAQ